MKVSNLVVGTNPTATSKIQTKEGVIGENPLTNKLEGVTSSPDSVNLSKESIELSRADLSKTQAVTDGEDPPKAVSAQAEPPTDGEEPPT